MTDSSHDKAKWNSRYSEADRIGTADAGSLQAAQVLVENAHLLPHQGKALDLACGLGVNAIFLASHGLDTSAWDISDVAIEKLQKQIDAQSLNIRTELRDVVERPPSVGAFDVIVVVRFLERRIVSSLVEALKPGGLIFYQTFTIDKSPDIGPTNPDYLLQANELLQLFHALRIRVYREEGMEGDLEKGFRNEVMLVAQKVI